MVNSQSDDLYAWYVNSPVSLDRSASKRHGSIGKTHETNKDWNLKTAESVESLWSEAGGFELISTRKRSSK